MKNGFTLIEMIAVVIIVTLIAMVTFPILTDQIANNKQKIDNTTEQIIFDATELYMTNNEMNFPKMKDNTYYVKLDTLVNAGLLTKPLTDYKTGKEIALTKCVFVKVNSKLEYDSFEMVDEC